MESCDYKLQIVTLFCLQLKNVLISNSLCYIIVRLVISILLALYVCDRNFALHSSEGLKSKRVVGTNGRSVLMIRVNSR